MLFGKNASGRPEYEAWIHIAWDAKKSEYAVLWFENTAVFMFALDGIGRRHRPWPAVV